MKLPERHKLREKLQGAPRLGRFQPIQRPANVVGIGVEPWRDLGEGRPLRGSLPATGEVEDVVGVTSSRLREAICVHLTQHGGSDRLEEPEPAHAPDGSRALDKSKGEQGLDRLDAAPAWNEGVDEFKIEPGADRNGLKHGDVALRELQQRPVEDHPKRSMLVARLSLDRIDATRLESLQDLAWRSRTGPGSRQLDGEREPVEVLEEDRDIRRRRFVEIKVRLDLSGAGQEQGACGGRFHRGSRSALREWKRPDGELDLAADAQRSAARCDDPQRLRGFEQPNQKPACAIHLFEVVDAQDRRRRGQDANHGLLGVGAGIRAHLERCRKGREDDRGGEGGRAIHELGCMAGRAQSVNDRSGEARLARSADPRERDQARGSDHLNQLSHLGVAADQRIECRYRARHGCASLASRAAQRDQK